MKYLADWQSYLVQVEGKAPASAEKYGDFIRMLEADIGDDPSALTFSALEAHLKGLFARGYADSSRAIAVTAIRGFARYLCARGILAVNPTLLVKAPAVYRTERPTLRPEEIKLLVFGRDMGTVPGDPIELRNRTMLWLMYIAGLRVGEPPKLRVDQLEWADGEQGRIYTILLHRGKWQTQDRRMPLDLDGSRLLSFYLRERPRIERPDTFRRRVVPIRPNVRVVASPFLFPTVTGGMLSRHRVWSIFGERLKAAGIKAEGRKLTPHVLRHSVATHLLDVGWTIKEVQEHMRHKSIETTAIYLHADHAKHAKRLNRMHPIHSHGKKAAPNVTAAMQSLMADLGK